MTWIKHEMKTILQENIARNWENRSSESLSLWILSEVKSLSRVPLFEMPWTVAYEVPPYMKFSKQEYWSGFPLPSLGDLPNPGIKPGSPALRADALPSEPPGPSEAHRSGPLRHSSFQRGLLFTDSAWSGYLSTMGHQKNFRTTCRQPGSYFSLAMNPPSQGQREFSAFEALACTEFMHILPRWRRTV